MSTLLTADWFKLDSYYRKFDLYTMNWCMDEGLDNMIVAGAPYGGPIAVVRDKKQFVKILTTSKPVITIYNCIGDVISKILWNNGVLIHMGWSDAEQLLCIQESGDVLIYDMFGAYQKSFSLGQDVRDTKVCKAQLFPNSHGIGLAVITSTNRMYLVNNVNEPKPKSVPDVPRPNEPITSWCVISSGVRSSAVNGFLACRDKEVYQCQVGESRAVIMRPEIRNPYTQVLSIVPSQNGRHVALFTDSGFLWIGSADLKNKYCEIDTGYIKQPKELVWCGSQALVGHWDDTMCVYGFNGSCVPYAYDGPFHIIPEIDCVRVISEMTHELIQKVPLVVDKIFSINSTAPGSYLVEASKQFQKQSHRADEYIRLVKPDLSTAVQDCIDAATFEFDPDVQKMLIRAAQFGKGFIPVLDTVLTDHYVKTCRWLRVLNAIRGPKVAMPLTFLQVVNLGERVLLDRLIWRRLHCLAGHIASYLQLKDGQTRVLSHWACYKVSQPHLDNESAAREIGEKLRNVPGISYTTIAMKAAEKGRKTLAIKILEYETLSKLQVPLLLTLDEGSTALLKATASGDTDLVYIVLLHLKEKMGKNAFERTIRSFPLAHALYIKYASQNREALRKVYVQEDDFPGQAATHIRDAIEQTNPGSVEASLISARECYKKAKNDFGASICEDSRKLCKQQSSLQETYGESFLGLSLHDSVKKLLDLGEIKLADKLRSEYRMPDKRYWWLRILTMAEKNEWVDLDKFSKAKKSPIGYEPFVDACLKHNKTDEALNYLPKCREDIKVKYYVKARFYEEAATVAFEQKNEGALRYVQGQCPAREVNKQQKISALLEQLSIRK